MGWLLSANTAMNVFARAVVVYRKIPFEVKAENKDASMKVWRSFCR